MYMGSLSFIDDTPMPIIRYPKARRDESVVDNYHGFPVADPYRWLEDPDSEETKEFVKSQVGVTERVLERCEAREKIRDRIKEQFNHPRYTPPFKRGDSYFYWHNSGLQQQDVLYVQDNIDDELEAAEVVIDPNKLSDDGSVSLKVCAVSEDAKYLAYGLSSSGSDWVNIRVMRIGELSTAAVDDSLKWVKFSSIAWTHDSKGFFYCRYPTPTPNHDQTKTSNVNLYHEVWYHYIGTDQSEDILCWRDDENPKYIFTPSVTEDGKFVLLYIEEGSGVNRKVYYLDLSSLPNGISTYNNTRNSNKLLPFVKLIDEFKASYIAVANDGPVFTFLTNRDAPRYKLARVDIINMMNWTDVLVIPESDDEDEVEGKENNNMMVLDSAYAVDFDKVLVRYISDVKSVLQIRDLETGTLLHTLPIGIGTVCGVSTRRRDSFFFVGFTSFLIPGIIYKCDISNLTVLDDVNIPPQMKIFRQISVPHFDYSEFQVQQVFVPSNKDGDNKDGDIGTKIPAFIVAKKDLVLNGSHPCLLFGYGGFNVSLMPFFSVARIVLLKHLDLVYAVANIRGGGEYGEEWHRAGSLSNKQNCFDDFISVAEFLVKNGYTKPSKLCIEGRSNGGLLVGACINQRPDLFACALAHVGVMDMLRFHKFTIGHAWTCDFGCSDIEEQFHWLIKYSPLHNVKRPWELVDYSAMCTTQYPATMLLTADHDDRVVPSHSLKLLATMQNVLCSSMETRRQTNPILGRIECNAGHGCGRPTQKLIDEAADRYGFMAKMLDASWID